MDIEQLYNIYLDHPSVQTDTRKLVPGDLFFALKGPSFNGNAFALKALEGGAAYALVDEAEYAVNEKTLLVDDVLTTLQELAAHHRRTFTIPFLAITGSNGKTTTKELIHSVLSTTHETSTTRGNLNNHIGIPLTILGIETKTEIAVIEMGANHIGEIQGYCAYTLPTHGIITNCGKAHLEGFGSIEGVRKGKGELFDHLRRNDGTAFVLWDHDYLRDMSRNIPHIIKYGTREGDITGLVKRNDPFLHVEITKGAASAVVQTQLVGEYNLPNVLVAVAVGKYFKVPDEAIISAIEAYTPSNSRSQMIEKGSNKIVLDAYNANPSSMKSAIENMAQLHGENKILMLGAMAELGKESQQEHAAIVDLIKKYSWSAVVLVGEQFSRVNHPFIEFTNAAQAREWYSQQHFEDALFLVKGSRSMQMEKILE